MDKILHKNSTNVNNDDEKNENKNHNNTNHSNTLETFCKLFFVQNPKHIGQYQVEQPGKKSRPWKFPHKLGQQLDLNKQIRNHLAGKYSIGSYVSHSDHNQCVYACLDFDLPKETKLAFLKGNISAYNEQKEQLRLRATLEYNYCLKQGYKCVLEDSVGGYHLWFFFPAPQPLDKAYNFVKSLNSEAEDQFPKQSELNEGEYGNFVRLPGRYHSITSDNTLHYSKFWNGSKWLEVKTPEQWQVFLQHCENNQLDISEMEFTPQQPENAYNAKQATTTTNYTGNTEERRLIAATATLKHVGAQLADYDDYSKFLMVCKGISERYSFFTYQDFDQIVQISGGGNYNPKENELHWNKAKPRHDDYEGAFIKYAQKASESFYYEKLEELKAIDRYESKSNRGYSETYKVNIDDVKPQDTTSFADIAPKVQALKNNEIMTISAPTGTGKSYFYAQQAVEFARKNQPVTIITGSIDTVENIEKYVLKVLEEQSIQGIHVTKNISKQHPGGLGIGNSESQGDIVITTYAYLGRIGYTDKISPVNVLLKDRVLLCDEIQTLTENFCKINLPLSERFTLQRRLYRANGKCPYKGKTQTVGEKPHCRNCLLGYERMDPMPGNYYTQRIRRTMSKADLEHQTRPLFRLLPSDIWSADTYENHDHMFFRPLDNMPSIELPHNTSEVKEYESPIDKENDIEFSNYVDSIYEYMLFPQLTMYAPTTEDKLIRPVDVEEGNVVRFPYNSCMSPVLKGLDILPFLQLMQADKIVIASATIPPELNEILDFLTHKKEWTVLRETVDYYPFSFSGTFLATRKRLSPYELAKIAAKITGETLFVSGTKSEADTLYKTLQAEVGKNNVEKFCMDSIRDGGDTNRDRPKTNMLNLLAQFAVAYLRNNALTGLNMPHKNCLSIDCSGIPPQIICTQKDRDARIQEVIDKVIMLIVQAIGRLLRSNQEAIPGQTVMDGRNIVILLHGIPCEAEDAVREFMEKVVNKKLFHELSIIVENFVTEKKPYENIAEAIELALKGEEIPNYREIEHKEMVEIANEKFKDGGLRNVPTNLRDLISTEMKNERARLAKRKSKSAKWDSLIQEAKERKAEGFTYSQFYKQKNIPRTKPPKKIVEKIKRIFNK